MSIDNITRCARRIGFAVGDALLESCEPDDRESTMFGIHNYIQILAGATLTENPEDTEHAEQVYNAIKYVGDHDVLFGIRSTDTDVCLLAYATGLDESIEKHS